MSIIHPNSQLISPPSTSHSCQVSNPHPLHPLLPDLKGRKSYKVGLTSDQITGHEWELKLRWALPLFTVQQDLLMADKQVAVYMVDWLKLHSSLFLSFLSLFLEMKTIKWHPFNVLLKVFFCLLLRGMWGWCEMRHVLKVCSQNGTRVVSVLHLFLACDPLKQCDIYQSHSSERETANAVNTAEVMIIFISPRHTSGNNDSKIYLFLLSDQMLDSPWVRRFLEFLADLEVPADPEGRLLLSLRGNHALPVGRHGDNQHGARQSVSQKNSKF